MASKTAQDQVTPEAIEELLDAVDKALDRVKTLYEQYFLGIQKQAPSHLHTDVERKLRDLTQLSIRNTGLRYRLATLSQKFGSYNAYWRRTVRQIENGTYGRNLSKIGREAVRTGADIPDEILAAMPKRMRDQVIRDREQALAIAKRHQAAEMPEELTLEGEPPPPDDDLIAMIKEPTELKRKLRTLDGAHIIDEGDADIDLAAFFASVEQEKPGTIPPLTKPVPAPVQPAPLRASSITRPPQPASPPSLRVPTGQIPKVPMPSRPPSGTQARVPPPTPRAPDAVPRSPTGPLPRVPAAVPRSPTGPLPRAPSQITRPNPIAPGAAAARGNVPVESMAGPFARTPPARAPTPPPRPPTPAPVPSKPPPGMTDADVNALYAKYVKAKELVGETAGPGARDKLLKTINAQAPKIMEQYKAKGVDFSVVVKDNQVIIRAKPKT